MKYSGLYFISNPSTNVDAALSTVNSLTQGIETSFQNATRQPPWSLFYRAFRDPIPPGYQPPASVDGKPQPYAHSYQHLLHLSSLAATRTYVYAQPVGQSATIASIPLRQQDTHASMLRHQSSALWTQRHVLSVREGTAYSGGLCTIQIGQVRATREGPQSGAISSPGVVLCITTLVGADDADQGGQLGRTSTENGADMHVDMEELDFEYAQAVIRECWNKIKEGKDLGRAGVKEFMMVAPAADANKEQQREAAVRMWCDALRMRG